MADKEQVASTPDPFSLRGLLTLLRKWYWLFLVFLGIGTILGTFLVGEQEKAETREYGSYLVAEFQDSLYGDLRADRLEALLKGDMEGDFSRSPLTLFKEKLVKVDIRSYEGGVFSVYLELKDSIPIDTLQARIQQGLRFGLESQGHPFAEKCSYKLLYSSPVKLVSDPRGRIYTKKVRGYIVLMVLSLFVGFLIALLAEKLRAKA
ncbi:MAG: hypothetical protein ABEH38_06160 [Flavobacteriales bacterium]